MPAPVRQLIASAYTWVEDIAYVGLGLLLSALVLTLLILGAVDFGRGLISAATRAEIGNVVAILDRILLVLLIVELLYTVQVSFRAHALTPEPFLLVGLISAIRRVLLLTTALGEQPHTEGPKPEPTTLIIELGVLTVLILVLSVSLMLLRRGQEPVVAARS